MINQYLQSFAKSKNFLKLQAIYLSKLFEYQKGFMFKQLYVMRGIGYNVRKWIISTYRTEGVEMKNPEFLKTTSKIKDQMLEYCIFL